MTLILQKPMFEGMAPAVRVGRRGPILPFGVDSQGMTAESMMASHPRQAQHGTMPLQTDARQTTDIQST